MSGACRHVINRGHGRAVVFRKPEHHDAFVVLPANAAGRFALGVHHALPAPPDLSEPRSAG